MFDFFASLFGSGFLLSKYMSDKRQTNAYNKKINNAKEINEMLNASLEQEETLKDMLLKNNDNNILESISSELTEIYGDDWKNHYQDLSNFDCEYSHIQYPWGVAFHILLAKQGLKPRMFSTYYDLMGNEDMTNRKIKVCEIIECHIQSFYPDLQMIFVPGSHIGKPDMFYTELYMGKIWWQHEMPIITNKWHPPVKRLW